MDLSHLTIGTIVVLFSVLLAEMSNGWTDAPCSTSAAVASGVLSRRSALWVTVVGNFAGLLASLFVGAAVAHTIGTGIVRSDIISVPSIGIAMVTTVIWAASAARLGMPISKTHSLLAALAGIGFAQGGMHALLPESGHWTDSGWIKAFVGVALAIGLGSALSWFLTRSLVTTKLAEKIPEEWWRRFQTVTVCSVAAGHGFNDGLKYVGVFTLVLFKASVISSFVVLPWVIVLCAFVMGAGTFIGGWRIHHSLDTMVNHGHVPDSGQKRPFRSYMGVCAEVTSAFLIWQTGFLGIPTSTNHATVSAMAGAKSAIGADGKKGKVHLDSILRILGGWIVTYFICFGLAYEGSKLFL